MTDKRKVYPKLGNAFAQQAYLDSLMQSSASAANTPTSDTFSLDMEERRRPEPLATRSRTQSLSPLKTAAQIVVNLPNAVKETFEMSGTANSGTATSNSVEVPKSLKPLDPVTPLLPEHATGINDAKGKARAATDPVLRKPVGMSSVQGSRSAGNSASFARYGNSAADGASMASSSTSGTPGAVGAEEIKNPFSVPALLMRSATQPPPMSIASSPEIFTAEARRARATPVYDMLSMPKMSFMVLEDSETDRASSRRDSVASHGTLSGHQQRFLHDGIALSDGQISPTRTGTFGRVGNVNIQTAPRVASASAMIEGAEPSPSSVYPTDELSPTPLLQPTVFSGMQGRPTFRYELEGGVRPSPILSSASVPIVFQGSTDEMTSHTPQIPFGDSVPPPPGHEHEAPEFERNVLHLIMGMHHHLDQETRAIARNLTAKHDDLTDQLIRKYDAAMAVTGNLVRDLGDKIATVEGNLTRPDGALLQRINEQIQAGLRAHTEEVAGVVGHPDRASSTSSGLNSIESLSAKTDAIMIKLDHLHHRFDGLEARLNARHAGHVVPAGPNPFAVVPGFYHDHGAGGIMAPHNAFASAPNVGHTRNPTAGGLAISPSMGRRESATGGRESGEQHPIYASMGYQTPQVYPTVPGGNWYPQASVPRGQQ